MHFSSKEREKGTSYLQESILQSILNDFVRLDFSLFDFIKMSSCEC